MVELIKLQGGCDVEVEISFSPGETIYLGYDSCRKCGTSILWAKTLKNQKPIPIKLDEQGKWISHFADCPYAKEFRKVRKPLGE